MYNFYFAKRFAFSNIKSRFLVLESLVLGLFISDPPSVPEMDLVFAITANAMRNMGNFQQMKDIIKTVIDKYGTYRIRYGLIAFGNLPVTRIPLNMAIPDAAALKRVVDSVKSIPGSSLDKALESAKQILETQSRPGVEKVLVVITDTKSSSSPADVEKQTKALEEGDVKVIPVALGKESDPNELSKITPNKQNLVDVDEGDEPEATAEIIMRKVLKGKNVNCGCLLFRGQLLEAWLALTIG